MKMTLFAMGKTPSEIKAWVEELSNITVTGINYKDNDMVEVFYEEKDAAPKEASWSMAECITCGKESPLNSGGYCARCWYIWTH